MTNGKIILKIDNNYNIVFLFIPFLYFLNAYMKRNGIKNCVLKSTLNEILNEFIISFIDPCFPKCLYENLLIIHKSLVFHTKNINFVLCSSDGFFLIFFLRKAIKIVCIVGASVLIFNEIFFCVWYSIDRSFDIWRFRIAENKAL